MFENLNSIKNDHPLLNIIVGIDANQYLGETQGNMFNYVPQKIEQVTSTKKRTHLQAQLKKSGVFTSELKDHILSTLPVK